MKPTLCGRGIPPSNYSLIAALGSISQRYLLHVSAFPRLRSRTRAHRARSDGLGFANSL
jgi:hypothetical protein